MTTKRFEGRSAAEAAIGACETLGLTRSELKYTVVEESGELLSRRVVIEVNVPEGAKVAAAEPSEASAPAPRQRGRRPRRTPAEAPAPAEEAPQTPATDLSEEDEAQAAAHQQRHDEQRTRAPRNERSDNGNGRRQRGGRNGRQGPSRSRDGAERRQSDEPQAPRPPRQERPNRPRTNQADNGIDNLLKLVPAPPEVPRQAAIAPQGARAKRALEVCATLVRMMGLEAETLLVEEVEAEFVVHLYGKDEERLIGKKGEVLLALQFIINRMLSRNEDEGEQLMTLDAGGFRQRRRVALEGLARTLAERAVAEHKAVRLSPMSAHDRRVFHLALKEMPSVTTRSEGDGMFRNLLIIPTTLVA